MSCAALAEFNAGRLLGLSHHPAGAAVTRRRVLPKLRPPQAFEALPTWPVLRLAGVM